MVIAFFRLQLQRQHQRRLFNLQLVYGLFLHRSQLFKLWLLLVAVAAEVQTDVVLTLELAVAGELSLPLVTQ
jgi:hypothetical protein